MQGLRCQLKSVLHDKFCLMTFLLPIIVAIALSFAGSIDFTALGQLHFGVQRDDLPAPAIAWLERYGPVTVYPTREALAEAINEPSTNLIGVAADQDGIKTIISGDELEIFRQAAVTLPSLYAQRDAARQATVHILAHPDVMAGFQDMFIAATLIVALFMGCTFNAMNMIAEKEDGVALINAILPMTRRQYLLQKLMVGFICGGLSALITAIICFSLTWQGAVLMLVLIILSAFVAALIGLMIGRASSGLMVGVVYIKTVSYTHLVEQQLAAGFGLDAVGQIQRQRAGRMIEGVGALQKVGYAADFLALAHIGLHLLDVLLEALGLPLLAQADKGRVNGRPQRQIEQLQQHALPGAGG